MTQQEIDLQAHQIVRSASIAELVELWGKAGQLSIKEGRFARRAVKLALAGRAQSHSAEGEEAIAALVAIGAV